MARVIAAALHPMTADARIPGDQIPPLPEGTVLVHIGPPKTGTSALQAAFHAHRASTIAQGVRYAGSSRHSGSAVLALGGRPSFGRDQGSPPMSKWHGLLRDVRRAREPRVLVSSEFFADVEPPAVRRAVDDLGRDRVHVVVTLRPLDRLIPSQWQQYVQSGLRLGWDEWLPATLNDPPGPTPTFWRRHRHDRLVDRWAEEVGSDRMSIVVIDDRDRDHILRVFERLLGLRGGTLVSGEDIVNRSMTWPEVEAVRAYSHAFKDAGLGNALFHKTMHFGAAPYMKTRVPPRDEPRIVLPPWARDAVAGISREMVVHLRATGVRVLGDLDALVATGTPADDPAADSGARGCVTPEIAAAMAVSMAVTAGHARETRRDGQRADLARYATYQLSGAVLGRARRRVGQWVERIVRPGREASTSRAPLIDSELAGGNLATARAMEARFEAERLVAPSAQRLLRRGLSLAVNAVPKAVAAGPAPSASDPDPMAAGCVAPEAGAWFALSMLEASGVVRSVGRRPGKLRPVLWAWVEPPDLARVPTLQLLRSLLPRFRSAAMSRFRR